MDSVTSAAVQGTQRLTYSYISITQLKITVVLMYARGVGTFLTDCCNPGHTEKHRAA